MAWEKFLSTKCKIKSIHHSSRTYYLIHSGPPASSPSPLFYSSKTSPFFFQQAVFSAIFYYAAIAIYSGWLIVGYSTIFTMAPVFSLVLDTDVTERVTFMFPELYQELQKGRALSNKTVFFFFMVGFFIDLTSFSSSFYG